MVWHKMLSLSNIKNTLKKVYDSYDNIRIGIAGSYANNRATSDSDLDIVVNGDSTRLDIAEDIKGRFDIPVDVLWVNLMKQEDEELDAFASKMELLVNTDSVYKTVMKEVIWI